MRKLQPAVPQEQGTALLLLPLLTHFLETQSLFPGTLGLFPGTTVDVGRVGEHPSTRAAGCDPAAEGRCIITRFSFFLAPVDCGAAR